jgi:tryptophan halogenase
MDRAVVLPTAPKTPPVPYTRSTAGTAGWRWRIPLQHRVGNGHVYCSEFITDDCALDELLFNIDGAPRAEPRRLQFTTGRRRMAWNKNVVAVGLASGFVEPLDSTSIHLIQRSIATLLSLFPRSGFIPAEIDLYNRLMAAEAEAVRDFVILHYKQTDRKDSALWRHVRDMAVPDSLAERIEVFANLGRVILEPGELFREASWVSVMLGQGLQPRGYDPLADAIPEDEIRKQLRRMRELIQRGAAALPSHADFLSGPRAAVPLA